MLEGVPVDSGLHDYERSDDCTNYGEGRCGIPDHIPIDRCTHRHHDTPHCAVCGEAQDSPMHSQRSR